MCRQDKRSDSRLQAKSLLSRKLASCLLAQQAYPGGWGKIRKGLGNLEFIKVKQDFCNIRVLVQLKLKELGHFLPLEMFIHVLRVASTRKPVKKLSVGEVGYVCANIKSVARRIFFRVVVPEMFDMGHGLHYGYGHGPI